MRDSQARVVQRGKTRLRNLGLRCMHAARRLNREPQHMWDSIDTFVSSDFFAPGIHTVPLRHGGRAQILVIGNLNMIPAGRRMPVAFNGAVGDRTGTQPPFFSGRGIFHSVGTQGVAVSDPIFDVDPDISIGWYTGLPGWRYQEQLAEIIAHLSNVSGRETLTFGGSAGGFAALEAASRLQASAFVWNPQTCVLWYHRKTVWRWLETLFPDTWHPGNGNWKHVRKRFMESTELAFDLGRHPVPSRVLYLQNDVDWHVRRHVTNYVDCHGFTHMEPGLFLKSDERAIALAHFGEGLRGHVKPQRKTITAALAGMLDESLSTVQVLDMLHLNAPGTVPNLSGLPERLVPASW